MKTIVIIIFIIFITIILSPVAFAQTATLSLSPSSGTFNKSCTFSLDIVLNTGGVQTDGTDAIVLYDTSRFSASSMSVGSIYADYPGNSIDESNGKVSISGLASVTTGFLGSGTLASIKFKVKDDAPTGASQIKFDFDSNDKSKTSDSNVVQRGDIVADVLNSVVNGNYTIGTGTCAAGAPGAGVGVGVATPSGTTAPYVGPPKALPPAGTEQFTFALAIVGSILTILGILGLALL